MRPLVISSISSVVLCCSCQYNQGSLNQQQAQRSGGNLEHNAKILSAFRNTFIHIYMWIVPEVVRNCLICFMFCINPLRPIFLSLRGSVNQL